MRVSPTVIKQINLFYARLTRENDINFHSDNKVIICTSSLRNSNKKTCIHENESHLLEVTNCGNGHLSSRLSWSRATDGIVLFWLRDDDPVTSGEI